MYIVETKIPVRYAETDQMGVVYHANYLIWFEVGRTELFTQLGFKYAEMEEDGILSPVINVQVAYRKPLRYGEVATIKTWIQSYNGLRVIYAYEVYNEQNERCVTGETEHICVKKDTFKPVSIRRLYPDLHEAYEQAKKQK